MASAGTSEESASASAAQSGSVSEEAASSAPSIAANLAVVSEPTATSRLKTLLSKLKNKFSGQSETPESPVSETGEETGSAQFGMEKAMFQTPAIPTAPISTPVKPAQPIRQVPIQKTPAAVSTTQAAPISAPPAQIAAPTPVSAPISKPVAVSAPASKPVVVSAPASKPAPVTAPLPSAVVTTPAPAPAQPVSIQPIIAAAPAPAGEAGFSPISPVTQLEALMQQATAQLDFERAIVLRDKMRAILKDPQVRAAYELELQMREAAAKLDFEKATTLRNRVRELQQQIRIPLPPEVTAPVAPPAPPKPEVKFRIQKVNIVGNELIALDEIQPLTQDLLGREITLSDVKKAASAIKAYYREKGFVAAYVYVPQQTIETKGEVELRVVEGRLGAIAVEGNKWFSSEVISGLMLRHGFEPGSVVNYQNLRNGLLDINEHRDIQTTAILRPGKEAQTTDLLLKVEDKMPFHVSIDANNYGTRLSGRAREGITMTHTNVTGHGDELTGRFQGSEGAYGVAADYNAQIFPKWGTRAGFGFVRGDVDLSGEFKALDIKGESYTYTPYILQPISKSEMWETSVRLGFNHKHIQNSLLDESTGKDQIRTISTVFNIEETDQYGKTFWPNEISFEPAAFGASDKHDTSLTRFGSGAPFLVYRSQLDRYHYLPHGMQLAVHASWQLTDDKLPPSEQFQLGGMSNVRGYPQGEYLGDSGAATQLELLVPPVFIPADWKIPYSQDKVADAVKLVGFYDLGMADLRSHLPGEQSAKNISGLGMGMRMRLYDKFTARLEYAFPLSEATSDGSAGVLYYGMSMDLI